MRDITTRQKTKDYPIHYEDQKGCCLFCFKEFTETLKPEYDHLNNNRHDNRIENHALVCHSCNVKKKYSDLMQAKALGKLKMNEVSMYVCERKSDDSGTELNLTSSQQINKINTRIAKQFLLEHTMNDEILYLRDACNGIVNLCQENNDTGSQSAVYRVIEFLTNRINGKYTICDYNGKNVIRRRIEN